MNVPRVAPSEQLILVLAEQLRATGHLVPEASALAGVWESWVQQVRAAWPRLVLDWEGFVRHVVRHLPTDVPLAEAVRTWHVADLALAFACASGDREALEAFDRSHSGELRAAVAKVGDATDSEEARQLVWQRLFTGDGEMAPRILNYSGRGPLRAWYRVALVRVLIDAKRQLIGQQKTLEEHRHLGVARAAIDPETDYFKHLYRQQFEAAIDHASRQLEPAERNVLRAYYVESLNVDQLAVAFGVHRATAARQVSRARDRLLELTRTRLQQELAISEAELDSILRLIRSQLQLSIRRLLESR